MKRVNLIVVASSFLISFYAPYTVATASWHDGLPSGTFIDGTTSQQMQWRRNRGLQLMQYAGVASGNETIICTNWTCPTSIIVNLECYNVVTNWWRGLIEYDILTTNQPQLKVACGKIVLSNNEQEARLDAFTSEAATSMDLSIYAHGLVVQSVDSNTNMMFLTNAHYKPTDIRQLLYKNIRIKYEVANTATNTVATNALAFTSELINAGLPEEDRIPLPPTP